MDPNSSARKYCKETGLKLNSYEDIRVLDTQSFGNFEQGMCEYLQSQESGDFITDSGAIQHLMYAYTSSPKIDELTFNMIRDAYWGMFDRYDLVFYCPGGLIPIVDDNRRTTNKAQNEMQDMLLKQLLKRGKERDTAHIYTLSQPDFNWRVRHVSGVIESYMEYGEWLQHTQRSAIPNLQSA